MSDTDRVEFLDSHAPPLADGDYTLRFEQVVVTPGAEDSADVSTTFGGPDHDVEFSVQGPRFSVPPPDIHSVFPPDGSRGDHAEVLPHVVIERSTMPWERPSPDRQQQETPDPWLAVVVFHGDEFEDGAVDDSKVITLAELLPGPRAESPLIDGDGVFVGSIGELEHGQHQDARVAVVDVERHLLVKLLPRDDTGSLDLDELRWQQHVRQRLHFEFESAALAGHLADDTVPDLLAVGSALTGHGVLLSPSATVTSEYSGDGWRVDDPTSKASWVVRRHDSSTFGLWEPRRAVVFANRLPVGGGRSTSHLVSVENLRGHEAILDGGVLPDGTALGNDATVRLVSLASWSFQCDQHHGTFDGLLTHVDVDRLHAPLPASSDAVTEDVAERARHYTVNGFTPLPHRLRGGQETYSIFRGPLVPMSTEASGSREARNADDLYRFDQSDGIFDVSYGAAFELGRLTALQSGSTSTDLYAWKRAHRQIRHRADQALDHGHIVAAADNTADAHHELDLPTNVARWFGDLQLLKGVPFDYLVPDERMLPVESIRFFDVDRRWVECLLDGAFSVGKVLQDDHDHDGVLRGLGSTDSTAAEEPALTELAAALHPSWTRSGFILRSEVVSGWPGLMVDGTDAVVGESKPMPTTGRLPIVRLARLADNVLLGIFEGNVSTVDLHLKPEVLHFGFEPGEDDTSVYKRHRGDDGEVAEPPGIEVALDKRCAVLQDLVESIEPAGPAEFALTMIEGAPSVRFSLDDSGGTT